MSALSRRSLVTTATALPALAVPAVAATDNSDAELIELGSQFRALWLELNRSANAWGPVWDAQREECAKLPKGASGADFMAVMERVEKRLAPTERHGDDIANAMDPIVRRIGALKATTIQGLGVKALLAHFECSNYWEESDGDCDLDRLVARQLIEAVENLAGVYAVVEA